MDQKDIYFLKIAWREEETRWMGFYTGIGQKIENDDKQFDQRLFNKKINKGWYGFKEIDGYYKAKIPHRQIKETSDSLIILLGTNKEKLYYDEGNSNKFYQILAICGHSSITIEYTTLEGEAYNQNKEVVLSIPKDSFIFLDTSDSLSRVYSGEVNATKLGYNDIMEKKFSWFGLNEFMDISGSKLEEIYKIILNVKKLLEKENNSSNNQKKIILEELIKYYFPDNKNNDEVSEVNVDSHSIINSNPDTPTDFVEVKPKIKKLNIECTPFKEILPGASLNKPQIISSKIMEDEDYRNLHEGNMKIGHKSEEIVAEFEKERLEKLGKPELASKVKIISKNPSYGYDIHSYEKDGSPRLIEVKVAKIIGEEFQFFISEHEYLKSQEPNANYYFYIVYEINQKFPKIKTIPGHKLDRIFIRPIKYRVAIQEK